MTKLADELEPMLTAWREHHDAERDVEAGGIEDQINSWFWGNAEAILSALRRPDTPPQEVVERVARDCDTCRHDGENFHEPVGPCYRCVRSADPVGWEPKADTRPPDTPADGLVEARRLLAVHGIVDGFTVEQAEIHRATALVDPLVVLHAIAAALRQRDEKLRVALERLQMAAERAGCLAAEAAQSEYDWAKRWAAGLQEASREMFATIATLKDTPDATD